jgi:hypothetical protein
MPATWLEHFLPLAWIKGTEWGMRPEAGRSAFRYRLHPAENGVRGVVPPLQAPDEMTLCEHGGWICEDHRTWERDHACASGGPVRLTTMLSARIAASLVSPNGHMRIRHLPNFVGINFFGFFIAEFLGFST